MRDSIQKVLISEKQIQERVKELGREISKDYEGKVILQLFDNNRQLATTYIVATGKDYPYIDWVCTKTGAYHLVYSFRDGKAGLAVGLLSMVGTM